MLAVVVVAVLLLGATQASQLTLGSAIVLRTREDASACHVTVDVPASRSGVDCKILFNTKRVGAAPRPRFDFFWKKDVR